MGLTGTMREAGTFYRQLPKQGAKDGVVRPFAMPQLAAVRAVALGVEVVVHLPCHHHFLEALEKRLAVVYR